MGLIDRIKQIFKIENEHEIVNQLAESYLEKKENGEKDPIDKTVEKVMEIINQSKDPERTAENLLKAALESEDMPNRVPEKVSTIISETEDIPDSVIAKAVIDSNTDVPDKVIDTMIDEGNINVKERMQLIKNIQDEDIVQKRIKNEFAALYRIALDRRDDEVVDRINELKKMVKDSGTEMDLQDLIEKSVAKKMAENYYDDRIKTTKIYTFTKVLPLEKMIDDDLSSMVETEFKNIEEKRGEKTGRFEKQRFKNHILKKVAEAVVYKQRKIGTFIIPQTMGIRSLNQEEEEVLVNAIQKNADRELTEKEIKEIREQIRGVIKNKKTKKAILIDKLNEMPEENIDLLANIIEDNQNLETLKTMKQFGLIEQFNLISTEKREQTIDSIASTLEKRVMLEKRIKENQNNKNNIENKNEKDEEKDKQQRQQENKETIITTEEDTKKTTDEQGDEER